MAPRGPMSQPAADALAELRRAPRHVMLKAIDRLEAALGELSLDESVPAGWFLSTASGYDIDARGRIDGSTAIADACALVAELSAIAKTTADDLPEGCLDAQGLAERWDVSERTLHRYRAQGLAARTIRDGRTRRLVFTPQAVRTFEQCSRGVIDRARTFARLDDDERERTLTRADELEATGMHATAIAHRIAEELGRSHETIRRLLRTRSGDGQGWTDRQRRLALRAHDRFLEPAAIAERLGRPTNATRRTIDAQRLARLKALGLESVPLAEPPQPRVPLGAPGPTLLADLVAEMREAAAPDRALERAITAYARFLVSRAAGVIAKAGAASLRAEPIDAAETDLLWAARLRVEALRPLLGIVLRSVEARLGGEIETLPARLAASRLQLALAAAAEATHRYDPARGGRLSAAVTLAVDHASSDAPPPATKTTSMTSSARRSFGHAPIEDWTRHVSPWQSFLDASVPLRSGLSACTAEHRAILEARFGLGERPSTLADIAERFDIHRPWVARRVREAARAAMRAGRTVVGPDTIDA